MNQIRSFRCPKPLVIVGAGLGLAFWILEAAVHVLIFNDSGLFEQVFRPAPHEVWMRLVTMGMFVSFGVYAHRALEIRRKAEDAVKRANSELSQIFETAADGMRIVDQAFNICSANETFASLAGVRKDELIGRKCYEVLRGHLCDTPGCPLVRVRNGDELVQYDADKVRMDDTVVPCIVTATPFRRPDGTLVGIVEDFKEITDRRRAERDLIESQQRLRELTNHLQRAREDERSRIAREIHDELGQALTALKMDLYWIRSQFSRSEPKLHQKLEAMIGLTGDTIDSVRRICSELRPTILDDFGLSAAIEWQADEFSKRTGIACSISADADEVVLDRQRSTAVFRILQEALTNISRHSAARKVRIEWRQERGVFSLRVQDDGKGIDLFERRKTGSFGLIGMQERVVEFGGDFHVGPGRQGGTTVKITLPTDKESNG